MVRVTSGPCIASLLPEPQTKENMKLIRPSKFGCHVMTVGLSVHKTVFRKYKKMH